jgi:hypothetical protein
VPQTARRVASGVWLAGEGGADLEGYDLRKSTAAVDDLDTVALVEKSL